MSVLYPPASPGGYALIIDGTTRDTGPTLTVCITRAVLHRRGRPAQVKADTKTGADCGSDCIPLIPGG